MSYIYIFDFGDMVKVGQSIKPANRRKEIEKENGKIGRASCRERV